MILALLIAPAAGALGVSTPQGAQSIVVTPRIHAIRALETDMVVTARCQAGPARLQLQTSTVGTTVRSLVASGRTLGQPDITRWNGWLAGMRNALSVQVDCTAGGVVVYLSGPRRADPAQTSQISVGWIKEGLFKLPTGESDR